jgi:hypothetical protein
MQIKYYFKQKFYKQSIFSIHLKEICLYFHCYFDEAPANKTIFTPQNNNIKTIANLNFNHNKSRFSAKKAPHFDTNTLRQIIHYDQIHFNTSILNFNPEWISVSKISIQLTLHLIKVLKEKTLLDNPSSITTITYTFGISSPKSIKWHQNK